MKPFIVLLVTFATSLLVIKLTHNNFEFGLPGRIAMCVMLLFTSIAHFKFLKGMQLMMPAFIPFKKEIVILTGFMEMALAILLLLPSTYYIAGWCIIAFFILLLPANINAAINHVNYETGTLDGNGPKYLWFRIPLQLFFIAWVYFSIML